MPAAASVAVSARSWDARCRGNRPNCRADAKLEAPFRRVRHKQGPDVRTGDQRHQRDGCEQDQDRFLTRPRSVSAIGITCRSMAR